MPPPDPALAFARELWLRAELIREQRRSRMIRQAVRQQPHESPPPMADWAPPSLLPPAPAPGEPVAPKVPLAQEIMAQVLRRYNWEPLPRPRRTRGQENDVPQQQTA